MDNNGNKEKVGDMALASTEELIEELRQGRMIVLMDDEDRENEGDLVIPAEKVTPEVINFMAKFGRGLICLTLSRERCAQLNLPLMVQNTNDLHGTNFTVSIEAARGVTTGISAADRAVTVQAAVAQNATPADIVMPGHIFPLMAQPGGVLVRAGHTEAGCDLARLAGCEPAAVIVEILNEDGTMARRADLEKFVAEHNLKLGTIADLIQYRNRNEKTVEEVADLPLQTQVGDFRLRAFRETVGSGEVHLALVKGEVRADQPTLVRVQMQDSLCDLLDAQNLGCSRRLQDSMKHFSQVSSGVLLLLRKEGGDAGLIKRLQSLQAALAAGEAAPGSEYDERVFGIGAQILHAVGVGKMCVLGTPYKMHALSGFGLEIIEHVSPDEA